MALQLYGFHHVTCASARIRQNLDFYTKTLGMRLVKRSVNQDDVSAYHLFYADKAGSPGSDLTFFDWPHLPPATRGNHTATCVALRVPSVESLEWWRGYLEDQGITAGELHEATGWPTFEFDDPEGLRLSMTVAPDPENVPWSVDPIPLEHAIRGLGPVELSVPDARPTERVLTEVMGMERVREYAHPDNTGAQVIVYKMATEGADGEIHLAVRPGEQQARFGAGAVHHVAVRTPDDEGIEAWRERLASMRVPNSGIIDRFWFKSLYFREPNGILFEIATDTPGFAVDEHPDHLGEKLILPPFLESQRALIEAGLKPLD